MHVGYKFRHSGLHVLESLSIVVRHARTRARPTLSLVFGERSALAACVFDDMQCTCSRVRRSFSYSLLVAGCAGHRRSPRRCRRSQTGGLPNSLHVHEHLQLYTEKEQRRKSRPRHRQRHNSFPCSFLGAWVRMGPVVLISSCRAWRTPVLTRAGWPRPRPAARPPPRGRCRRAPRVVWRGLRSTPRAPACGRR